MRYRDAYRSRPPSEARAGSMPSHSGDTDVAQPYGALHLAPPPTSQRNPFLKRLLWWTLPVALVLLLTGGSLIALWAWSASTLRAAEGNDWSQARVAYSQQAALTRHFPQPWVGQYNLGTALVDSGEVDEGLEELRDAYDGVPKAVRSDDGTIGAFSYECSVRFNLSAALEKQGDSQSKEGADDDALDLYESALEWVAPCQMQTMTGDSGSESPGQASDNGGDSDSSGEDGPGEQAENEQVNPQMNQATGESADRLREKIDRLTGSDSTESGGGSTDPSETEGEGDGSGSAGSDSETNRETDEERERREQLESKNQNQEQRQREKDESRNRIPGVGGW